MINAYIVTSVAPPTDYELVNSICDRD